MAADGVALVSQDRELIADVRRLCAAAGQDVQVITERQDIGRLRRRLVTLLVDAAAPEVSDICATSDLGAGHGAEVIVLTGRPDAVDPWRTAVRIGARRVLSLPTDSRHLLDTIALAHESPAADGPLVVVVGGSGGVGASTFAAALAWVASTCGPRATLIDLDPAGGGADLLLGLEGADGLRWVDLNETRGVVPAAALHQRLPRIGQLGVLSCGRVTPDAAPPTADVSPAAATAVIAAARRGNGSVVVDLPRWGSEVSDVVLGACDLVLVVVAAEVRAIAAAAVTVRRVGALCDDVRVVLCRRPHSRLGAAQLSDCIGRPVIGSIGVDPRLATAADRGELAAAMSRSRVGSVAKDVWTRFAPKPNAVDVGASGASGP